MKRRWERRGRFRRHHHGHPRRWLALHGIHRRLVGVLIVALMLGGVAGVALHVMLGGGGHAFACVFVGALVTAWPLGWVATLRIARPLEELARFAGDLKGGRIEGRGALIDAANTGPEEVGEVASALRGMADRVARQLADQRALMAAVSHELRSPLARARVQVEILREGGPPTGYDALQAEIDAMDALVGDLLAAARIDFEALSMRPLDLRDVALRALQVAKLPADVLRVEDVGRDGGAQVVGDATLLTRAVSGLLDNARRYGAHTLTLSLSAPSPGHLRLAVDDDGPGFAPGDEERAFAPFWRGPPADADRGRAPSGEGLGLALVRQIAAAHGGQAGAENRPAGGARVWIELPGAE